MDLTRNESVQLLWPFHAQRYSADWVAHFDLWILVILLAGALLPQLFALVTEEIGARSKAPRGRIGASIALLAVFVYIGARFILHGNAVPRWKLEPIGESCRVALRRSPNPTRRFIGAASWKRSARSTPSI